MQERKQKRASTTRRRGGRSSRTKNSRTVFKVLNYVAYLVLFSIFGVFLYELKVLHREQVAMVDLHQHNKDPFHHPNDRKRVVPFEPMLRRPRDKQLRQQTQSQQQQQQQQHEQQPPHLFPPVPFEPPFAPIPNGDALIDGVLSGRSPTMAGVVALLRRFFSELHDSHRRLATQRASEREVVDAYFSLARKHLVPFDRVYRGRTVFPVREDGSLFLSLAAFREHLLAATLRNAYDRAARPDDLFVGVVAQNCFGRVAEDGVTIDASGTPCRTGARVVGKYANGRDRAQVFDAPPDVDGVAEFCDDPAYRRHCVAGRVRVLRVHETESLGPAAARYHASKLWGGETYFAQTDSHLRFAVDWDDKYRAELRATKAYPRSILSSYPPGFDNDQEEVKETNGARLCHCSTNALDPNPMIRINTAGNYRGDEPRPTQIAFVAAGFFFARAELLRDVPFDPFAPWCFMGEEIALSLRSWTSGWTTYAPRKNLIAHQYRPGRMGLPKFWGTVNRLFGRGAMNTKLQKPVIERLKYLAGYPGSNRGALERQGLGYVLEDVEHYGVGKERTLEEYMTFVGITVDEKNNALRCSQIRWCSNGELE